MRDPSQPACENLPVKSLIGTFFFSDINCLLLLVDNRPPFPQCFVAAYRFQLPVRKVSTKRQCMRAQLPLIASTLGQVICPTRLANSLWGTERDTSPSIAVEIAGIDWGEKFFKLKWGGFCWSLFSLPQIWPLGIAMSYFITSTPSYCHSSGSFATKEARCQYYAEENG